MNYTNVIESVKQYGTSLIYVAVGCAAHPGELSQGKEQQYPRFVREWSGKKVCILIDPCLEEPRSTMDFQATHSATDTLFLTIQKNFYYQNEQFYGSQVPQGYSDDVRFMEDLCAITLSTKAKMIVQDYTGRDIQSYYPIDFHPDILQSVLYDVTYGDGGCYIDLDAVHILNDTAGNFLQPAYSTFSEIYGKVPDPIFQKELSRRKNDLLNIHTYTCFVRGLREECTWFATYDIQRYLNRYGRIYRVNRSDAMSILTSAAKDICATASCFLSAEEIDSIVSSPSYQFMNLFQNLQVVLKISA